MLSQFQSLLESIVADPAAPINRLAMLSAVEYEFRQAAALRPRRAVEDVLRNGDAKLPHFVAPRDDVEIKLAELWQKVLNVSKISADSDFFDAGGHSLLAARLLSQIERTFGQKISVAAFLYSPTIQGLAARLRADTASAARTGSCHPVVGIPRPILCADQPNPGLLSSAGPAVGRGSTDAWPGVA